MTFPFGWTSHPVTCDHRQRVNTGTDGTYPKSFLPIREFRAHKFPFYLHARITV